MHQQVPFHSAGIVLSDDYIYRRSAAQGESYPDSPQIDSGLQECNLVLEQCSGREISPGA